MCNSHRQEGKRSNSFPADTEHRQTSITTTVCSLGEETYNEFWSGIQFQESGVLAQYMRNLLADMLKVTPPVPRSIQRAYFALVKNQVISSSYAQSDEDFINDKFASELVDVERLSLQPLSEDLDRN